LWINFSSSYSSYSSSLVSRDTAWWWRRRRRKICVGGGGGGEGIGWMQAEAKRQWVIVTKNIIFKCY
jgi:hypothetical protein